jgi:hypothetical protein
MTSPAALARLMAPSGNAVAAMPAAPACSSRRRVIPVCGMFLLLFVQFALLV